MKGLITLIALVSTSLLTAQPNFSESSEAFGLTYEGRTYGSSWGDFNNDGWMDIFMSCHYHIAEPFFTNDNPKLYINEGGESLDSSLYSFDTNSEADLHGTVFFDHDRDGDKDLLILSGGTRANLFYINDGSTELFDSAVEYGLDVEFGRGRQTTCFDFNNDGWTDLLLNNNNPASSQQPAQIRIRNFGAGYNLEEQFGWNEDYSACSQISDLNGDGITDLISLTRDSVKVFSRSEDEEFTNVLTFAYNKVEDMAIADFNNDLLPDILLTRGNRVNTNAEQMSDNVIHSTHVSNSSLEASGMQFFTQSSMTLSLLSAANNDFTLHLGSDSVVDVQGSNDWQSLVADPTNQVFWGWQSANQDLPGIHVFFGMVTAGVWRLAVNATGTYGRVTTEIVAEELITNFIADGVFEPGESERDILLMNNGDFTFTESPQPAFQFLDFSKGVTCGDYDNDGDVDIYVVGSNTAVNTENFTFENMGDGNFTREVDGWNTMGKVPGNGDSPTTGDINNDGFLDLLVTNGATSLFLDSAKLLLFVNQPNDNNWVKFSLEGVESNIDGFGAKVYVTSGGVTQLREMNGGIHTSCQDDPRLHFGLGANEEIDLVQIQWPSGAVDQYDDLTINTIHTLTEGDSPLNTSEQSLSSFNIYPNPSAFGELNVSISSNEGFRYRLIDIQGRVVDSGISLTPNLIKTYSDLEKGMYFIELRTMDGSLLGRPKWVVS